MNPITEQLKGWKTTRGNYIPGLVLAKLLGITQVTLRRRARIGLIPSEKSPGSDLIRFPVDTLIGWVERGYK